MLALIRDGLIRCAFDAGKNLDELEKLAIRFRDRSPDLADLCLIRMSELFPKLPVITTDVKDFRIYRRGRNEAIPLIYPSPTR